MLDDIDREAEREGMAMARSRTYKPKQRVIKKLTTGATEKEKPLDLLQALNIVQ